MIQNYLCNKVETKIKGYIWSKQVKERRSTAVCVSFTPSASFFTFFLKNNNKASNNQKSHTNQPVYSFSTYHLCIPKPCYSPPKHSLWQNLPDLNFFFIVIQYKRAEWQLHYYRPTSIILEIALPISSNIVKLHFLTLEKNRLNLAKVKLEKEA